MRALTLTQPWASLIAIGSSTVETRSWRTEYRGPLAIHAAKGFPREAAELCATEPFASALAAAGIEGAADLPRGAVIALCALLEVVPIPGERAFLRTLRDEYRHPNPAWEIAFGDYSRGRFAWRLADVCALAKPLACRGMLGLWTVGPAIAAKARAQCADGRRMLQSIQ